MSPHGAALKLSLIAGSMCGHTAPLHCGCDEFPERKGQNMEDSRVWRKIMFLLPKQYSLPTFSLILFKLSQSFLPSSSSDGNLITKILSSDESERRMLHQKWICEKFSYLWHLLKSPRICNLPFFYYDENKTRGKSERASERGKS
jgi:hypothetical protein